MTQDILTQAKEKFEALVKNQIERAERIKKNAEWISYQTLTPLIIGICMGDGIGPEISKQAQRILEHILRDEVKAGKIMFKTIDGLTLENRINHLKAIPDAVLEELKSCHVILKGPTTTPQKGDGMPNIESANVAMRRELDLFANVRPVSVPKVGIDWVFFRENTEGAYILGSSGFDLNQDVSIDFKITTEPGSERIIRLAFEFARKNNRKKVTVVTKSNILKSTDGRFSAVARRIAQEYSSMGIACDEWYIDIMSAKLLDPVRQKDFQVFVLPNLYGDILTDEAAQIQGGVGTAGSANIGKQYAMFEAIHGSAPRMVAEGREKYADPSSMIKAAALLLAHIGYREQSSSLEKALDICCQFERRLYITGRSNGSTAQAFADYILDWYQKPNHDKTAVLDQE